MDKTILLEQKFNYAKIRPFKNYSLLKDKDCYTNIWDSPYTHYNLPFKESLKRKNTFFFYGENYDEQKNGITLRNFSNKISSFYTQNDKHIKNHFGNPFSEISTSYISRSIYIKNGKLTIKLFTHSKTRLLNQKYFKKSWNSKGITINLKTGDIITFNVSNQSKIIRKNYFFGLYELINSTNLFFIKNNTNLYTEKVNEKFLFEMNDDEVYKILYKCLNDLKFNLININIDNSSNETKKSVLLRNLINLFIKFKGIKVSDDYYRFIVNYYPGKKILQKNDNKLIISILDKNGIKSKYLTKLLHKNPKLDIEFIITLSNFFGEKDLPKYLSNININLLPNIENNKLVGKRHWVSTKFNLNDIEKSNLVKLLNEFVTMHSDYYTSSMGEPYIRILNAQISQLSDHFVMIERLKKYIPTIGLRANTWKSFNQEHIILSRQVSRISKGYTTEMIYDQEMLRFIEEPINYDNHIFYPVVLKKDSDYLQEGSIMHHCVGTYSESMKSLIISLRCGSTDSFDRITLEYHIPKRTLEQDRSYCNSPSPDHFKPVLSILNERILGYKDSLFPLELIKKDIEINDVDLLNLNSPEWVVQP